MHKKPVLTTQHRGGREMPETLYLSPGCPMLCVCTFVVHAVAAQELGVLAALTSEAYRLLGRLPWSRCCIPEALTLSPPARGTLG